LRSIGRSERTACRPRCGGWAPPRSGLRWSVGCARF